MTLAPTSAVSRSLMCRCSARRESHHRTSSPTAPSCRNPRPASSCRERTAGTPARSSSSYCRIQHRESEKKKTSVGNRQFNVHTATHNRCACREKLTTEIKRAVIHPPHLSQSFLWVASVPLVGLAALPALRVALLPVPRVAVASRLQVSGLPCSPRQPSSGVRHRPSSGDRRRERFVALLHGGGQVLRGGRDGVLLDSSLQVGLLRFRGQAGAAEDAARACPALGSALLTCRRLSTLL